MNPTEAKWTWMILGAMIACLALQVLGVLPHDGGGECRWGTVIADC